MNNGLSASANFYYELGLLQWNILFIRDSRRRTDNESSIDCRSSTVAVRRCVALQSGGETEPPPISGHTIKVTAIDSEEGGAAVPANIQLYKSQ